MCIESITRTSAMPKNAAGHFYFLLTYRTLPLFLKGQTYVDRQETGFFRAEKLNTAEQPRNFFWPEDDMSFHFLWHTSTFDRSRDARLVRILCTWRAYVTNTVYKKNKSHSFIGRQPALNRPENFGIRKPLFRLLPHRNFPHCGNCGFGEGKKGDGGRAQTFHNFPCALFCVSVREKGKGGKRRRIERGERRKKTFELVTSPL